MGPLKLNNVTYLATCSPEDEVYQVILSDDLASSRSPMKYSSMCYVYVELGEILLAPQLSPTLAI